LKHASAKFGDKSRHAKCLVLLCVLLVLAAAVAQAVHFHPVSPTNEVKNCAVCQLAAATALAILVIALQFVRRQLTFTFSEERPQTSTVVAPFSLFSRPPPLA
jgi:membrane protein YdbS with pleckstrin-like domain